MGIQMRTVSHRLLCASMCTQLAESIWGDYLGRWAPTGGSMLLGTALGYSPAPFQPELQSLPPSWPLSCEQNCHRLLPPQRLP